MSGPEELARRLADGGLLPERWRPSFTRVDRAGFLPDRVWLRAEEGYRPLDRAADPERWSEAAYQDRPLVTQLADPDGPVALLPTSSASMPRVVAAMLDALDLRDGQRVLEAGTGTGYNAALISDRLGDDALVTTIEADADLADLARERLRRAGHAPTVLAGDADRGCPERAPYDRVILTYAVHRVPPALVAQTRPGGLLVLPWGTGLYNGVLLTLTAHGDGTASGPVTGDSSFMWDRNQSPRPGVMAAVAAGGPGEPGRTGLDPREVLGDPDAAFAVGAQLPDCRYSVGPGPEGEFTLWLANAAGSWASVDYRPGAAEFPVEQHGPRRLWRDVEAAHTHWRKAGSPSRTRHGLTMGAHAPRLWLDDPAHTPYPAPPP